MPYGSIYPDTRAAVGYPSFDPYELQMPASFDTPDFLMPAAGPGPGGGRRTWQNPDLELAMLYQDLITPKRKRVEMGAGPYSLIGPSREAKVDPKDLEQAAQILQVMGALDQQRRQSVMQARIDEILNPAMGGGEITTAGKTVQPQEITGMGGPGGAAGLPGALVRSGLRTPVTAAPMETTLPGERYTVGGGKEQRGPNLTGRELALLQAMGINASGYTTGQQGSYRGYAATPQGQAERRTEIAQKRAAATEKLAEATAALRGYTEDTEGWKSAKEKVTGWQDYIKRLDAEEKDIETLQEMAKKNPGVSPDLFYNDETGDFSPVYRPR